MGGVCGRPSDTLTASLQQSSGDQTLTISLCKNLPRLAKQFVNQQGGQFAETHKPADC